MNISRAAKFSDDGKHRLVLGRLWNTSNSKIMFIGLNPSTADDQEDDHTVTRLINFADGWGFGGFYLCNLYSYISTDPDELAPYYLGLSNHSRKLVEKRNLKALMDRASICSLVVFCWGAGGFEEEGPADRIIRTFKDARCFGKNKNGSPKHPLYLPSHLSLIPFRETGKSSALLKSSR